MRGDYTDSLGGNYYLIKIIDGIEPELSAPFKGSIQRDKKAIQHRKSDPEKNDSLFRLNMDNGKPKIFPYTSHELGG
jgi:hypothetical protein